LKKEPDFPKILNQVRIKGVTGKMFLRTKLTNAGLLLTLLIATGAGVQAQQPSTQNPTEGPGKMERRGRGFRRGPGPGGNFGPRVLGQLNLTDDQKKQVHAIVSQTFESNKATREEMRQLGEKRRQGTLSADDEARARILHKEIRAAMGDTETRIAAVLTAEQKAKAQELMKERKAGSEGFGDRRRGLRDQPRQGNPPATKPSNP
jgi:Spy/CpxP family protein refolding chaperone